MPIKHVVELLNAIDTEKALRVQMYECKNAEEIMKYLLTKGYVFTHDEFEDAIHYLHLRCQSYEEAGILLQKADWLRFQLLMNENTEM